MPKTYYDVSTPEFVLSFPHLFEPQKFEGEEKASYSCIMLFDKNALGPLKEAVKKAVADMWPKGAPKSLRSPFRDGDEKAEAWGEEFAGKAYIRAKTQKHPVVIDQKMRDITDPEAIYAGCVCRAQVTPFCYDKAGNSGVGFYLNGIQLVRRGERIGGGGQSREAVMKSFTPLPDDLDDPTAFNPDDLDEI